MNRCAARPAVLAAILIAAALPAGAANETPAPSGGSPNATIGGQPAVRQGDGVAGGTSPNVFINGRPAAIQGSRTDCGGVIVGGSSNVFINGRPAATSGSTTTPCPPR
ncbi:PAAR domain-containing protein [Rhabdaerophilum sp. SD176]|uniref:PAAR domain-containing protein n=1 Tax=Rhabdaerophilum sp. SD176 TaxID=2983548 RepID=UPI0024DFEBE2|nr:PAAR domain-containing protein [Rhabdaerophilum sp. SD176]